MRGLGKGMMGLIGGISTYRFSILKIFFPSSGLLLLLCFTYLSHDVVPDLVDVFVDLLGKPFSIVIRHFWCGCWYVWLLF